MASLKDMRVRIASTKATQKITKAMQMVAASKLRRAQTAAEAARPYAEKMDAVISNIASAAAGSPGAPALLAGTGKDQVHLLLVCTGERGLSGAFNSSIVRLARERALFAAQPGQRGQDFLRRPQGLRAAPPNLREEHHRARRPALGSPARLRQCRRHRQEGSGALRGRRVRRLHAVLFALQIRDLADPDRPAGHSAGGGSAGRQCRSRRRPTNTSRKKTRS
jgi:hypothetical protein